MPRILFVAAHKPNRSPSQRYRFEQFVPYWESKGFEVTMSWVLEAEDYLHLYAPGAVMAKARIYLNSHRRRSAQVRLAAGHDLIFLQRETFMTGGVHFERLLAATGVPLIYDFDDAIWLMNVSDGNRKLRWLKDPGKIQRILPLAKVVIAGNNYLAQFAGNYHPRVEMIPTVIDTDKYLPVAPHAGPAEPLTICWTGSRTTLAYLMETAPMLLELRKRSPVPFKLRVICDVPVEIPGLDVENRPWDSGTETTDLADIDIGIMPMPEDEWGKGKCGFKGLQYMGMGKPAVLQDHGANRDIVQQGVNGFLASTADQWIQELTRLLADAELRRSVGTAARRTVEEKYSVRAWRDRYVDIFNELIENKK